MRGDNHNHKGQILTGLRSVEMKQTIFQIGVDEMRGQLITNDDNNYDSTKTAIDTTPESTHTSNNQSDSIDNRTSVLDHWGT